MASQSGSLTLHPSPAPIGRDALAAAAERRRGTSKLSTKVQQELQLKEKRNTFQRLIDPGIIGPNSREQALKSLRTLHRLALNLINEPDRKEYTRFRPNNEKVKKLLIEPKGVLEYAVEMGFREKSEEYEAYYVFCDRFQQDLRLGAEVLEAHIALYEDKKEMEFLDPVRERVLKEEAQRKVKLQIVEDRIAQKARGKAEKETRGMSPQSEGTSIARSISSQVAFQGEGKTLGHN